jgi:hypothetical protein
VSSTVDEARPLPRAAQALLGICALCLFVWIATLFMSTRPTWTRELILIGILCAAFAGTLRRNALRRQRRASIGDA